MGLKQGPGAPTPHCVRRVLLLWGGGDYQLEGNGHPVGSLVTTETREGHAPYYPFDKTNQQLGHGASSQEGQSSEQGVGEAGTGQTVDGQKAREQPS